MSPMQNGKVPPNIWIAALLLVIAVIGIIDHVIDYVTDQSHQRSVVHLVTETVPVLLSLGAALYLWVCWLRAKQEASAAKDCLQRQMRGLGEAIVAQLRAWGLSEAECCIAIPLLKGYSHRDIAAACGRSERTVRQHAVAVYRKSGLSGRAELAAFFIDDLLPPIRMPGRDGHDASGSGCIPTPKRAVG